MKISSRLRIAIYTPAIIAVVVISALVYSFLDMSRTQQNGASVRDIRSGITRVNYTLFSYTVNHGDSQRLNFLSEQDSVSTMLAAVNFQDAAQQNLLIGIRDDISAMKGSFTQLVAFYNNGSAGNVAGTEDQLVGSLLQKTYDADSKAAVLRGLVDDGLTVTEFRTTGLIFIVLLLAVIPLTIVLVRTRRDIMSSISNLSRGAAAIGSGDLDYKVDDKGKDELGDLSRAVNRMSSDLKNITASKTELEKEIEERKQAERDLAQSEQRWATTLASIGDAVIATDVLGKITFMNPIAEHLTGWRLKDAVKKPIGEVFNIINELTRKPSENPVAKVIEKGTIVGLANHTILIGKAGREIPIDDSGAPIRSASGAVTGVVLVFRDITERRKAEEEIARSERKYRSLNLSMTEGLCLHEMIYDDSGEPVDYRIIDINPSYERITGLAKREVVGKKASELYGTGEPPYFDIYTRVAGSGKAETFETYFPPMDKYFSISAFSPGKGTFATVFSDITTRTRAEAALRYNESRLRRFYESGLIGVIYWNMDGAITDANDKFLEMVGYTREDLTEGWIDWANMTPPEYKPLDDRSMEELKTAGVNSAPFEKEYIRKDGSRLPILISGAMLDDERFNGVAFVMDITGIKAAEQEMGRLNRQLRAISDCNQVIVRATDEPTLLNDICRIVVDEVGYTMAWVGTVENDEGKTIRPVAWYGSENGYLATSNITWADTERGRGSTGIAARTGKTDFCQDFTTDPKAAPWREAALARGYKSSIALPLFDVMEEVFGVLTIYSNRANGFNPAEVRLLEELSGDLAFGVNVMRIRGERDKAEDNLQLERDKLLRILGSMKEEVGIVSSDFDIEYINPAMHSQFGDVIGRKCYQCFAGLDAPCHNCNYEEVLKGKTVHREFSPSTVDTVFEVTDSPLRNADGTISRLVTWHNITERKKIEQLKDEFIGMVSHEIRTPLTVIIGSLAVSMEEGIPETESKELVSSALKYAQSLSDITENLLELSRYQSNRLNLQPIESDIAEIAKTVIDKLSDRSSLHKLTLEMPFDLPTILVDPLRIERVIYNLVENAIKYSPDGGKVKIFARLKDSELIVGISDQGFGISGEDQGRLFKSFERLQAYEEHSIPGLGLGLRVCDTLVKAHNGRIWLESRKGKGSTFYFSVPVSVKRQ
jgi:PAS domain S-box-containing protein